MTKKFVTLQLDLGEQSYPIYIGQGLRQEETCYTPVLNGQRCAVVCDEVVAGLYLDDIQATIPNALPVVIPVGEKHKTLATVETICSKLLEHCFDRNSVLIALGGGIVGDITGFAAGCYQRGVKFLQVPTTLLAQVDASVGGKTGVNHPLGKNMIGLFHQPRAVIIDLETLRSLPQREIAAGIAEIIKYGVIADAEFFTWLEKHIDDLKELQTRELEYAIRRSCEIKAKIVAMDQLEKTGARMLLNYGHTFGHAIETGLGHGTWLHGEAVGCGMVLAARFSEQLGLVSAPTTERITRLIKQAGLPERLPGRLDRAQMVKLMQRDKKNLSGKQHLILIHKIGSAFVENKISPAQVQNFLMSA